VYKVWHIAGLESSSPYSPTAIAVNTITVEANAIYLAFAVGRDIAADEIGEDDACSSI
jgi:hypothetical protein